MITAGDFRNGLTFEINGQPHIIVEFQHVKPGKGAAFVRTKYKNLITGAIREESFNPTAKFSPARVDRAEMQYLYNDGEVYYVMDVETFDQITLPMEDNKDAFKFVRENTTVKVLSYNGSVFGVEPENFVVLEVTETEPGLKGNTATNTLKPATVETGAEVRVPLFIEQGELIEIDTRDGSYMGRAKAYENE
jgi:elongation factor P